MRLAWSPDSTELAYQSSGAGNQEIYSVSVGSTATRLTTNAAADGDPDWRPAIPSSGLVIASVLFPQRACASRPSAVKIAVADAQGRPLPGVSVVLRGGFKTVRATTGATGVATGLVRAARGHRGRLSLTVVTSAPARGTVTRGVSIPRC